MNTWTEGAGAKFKTLVSGDSISKGVIYDESRSKYVILEDNYVSLLQDKLKGGLRNTARFGNTLMKGFGNLQRDVVKDKPDIVLIEYGGNDCDFHWEEIALNPDAEHNPKTAFPKFEAMLLDMIDYLKGQNIVPVLMNLPPLNADSYFKWVSGSNPKSEVNILKWLGSVTKIYWWQEKYNSTIMKVAENTGTRLIDIRSAFLQEPDFTRLICVDGIHPNREGHRIIYDKVLSFIRSSEPHLLQDGGFHPAARH
ncbi:SGNH/GDSL hydrolase family protein [Paenibacillus tepidiphilus]|uniref:SGNH/GDSL hydrolase family protein n=1 Tax=Paenibacillus tepidiphilus TaxID=2608683 RepID=UPI001239E65F|nr:SGNH/GDSL hydrolase family protein [Paenibacillus tepidiphilus]